MDEKIERKHSQNNNNNNNIFFYEEVKVDSEQESVSTDSTYIPISSSKITHKTLDPSLSSPTQNRAVCILPDAA